MIKFTPILRKEIFLPNITNLRKGNQFFIRTTPKLVRSDRINNVYAYLRLFVKFHIKSLIKRTVFLINDDKKFHNRDYNIEVSYDIFVCGLGVKLFIRKYKIQFNIFPIR